MNVQPRFIQRAIDRRAMTRQDSDEFEAWLRTQGMTWQGLDSGAYEGVSIEVALLAWTMKDPVRWVETFLTDQRTGKPYQLFDYQRASMRAWHQDTVHQCGAEVGKTREIICLLLWGAYTSMGFTVDRPWFLVGAPQQTHLDEIIMAVEEQVGASADGSASGSLLSADWLKPKRTPHTMHRIRCPSISGGKPGMARIYYRPAGHDGEAFRGVHVHGMAFLDEAAKLKSKLHFSEFYRALEPGCKARVYSVPDGDNSTDYYKLTQRAVPDLQPGVDGVRLFKWAKTMMPPPFWTAERDAEFVRRFGGRLSPGYQRNVLGEHGQAENPVWGWPTIMPNVADLPGFRILKLRAENARDELHVELVRISLAVVEGRKVPTEHVMHDAARDLSPYVSGSDAERRVAWRTLLAELLEGEGAGVFFGGADLGEMNDPTELIVSEQRGRKLVDALRVSATGLPYHAQRELLFCVSELFAHGIRWGVDLGAAGSSVVKDLQTLDAYDEAHFDECLSGFQFAGVVDCIGEDGEALTQQDKEGQDVIVRAPAKHWATQCISARLQQVGYALAYDTEALNWMANHTAREGAKFPIYSKRDDHAIDARRQQMLRILFDEAGADFDVFASGTYQRKAA